ncbi:50S ribosomal protein L32 [Microtetraspora niveoalba]|uniref:50S ribosomal protein L32 n=1 Tax=Microtetraspora niveoalba TaxID=46175 RepID=UPI000A050BC9
MAVPKRRTSRSNTRHRRSRWKAVVPDLVPITVNGQDLLGPRRLVRAYRRPPGWCGGGPVRAWFAAVVPTEAPATDRSAATA